MDLENSLITTWKDTQVLDPTTAGLGTLPAAHPGSPLSHIHIWVRTFPLLSPLCPSP